MSGSEAIGMNEGWDTGLKVQGLLESGFRVRGSCLLWGFGVLALPISPQPPDCTFYLRAHSSQGKGSVQHREMLQRRVLKVWHSSLQCYPTACIKDIGGIS